MELTSTHNTPSLLHNAKSNQVQNRITRFAKTKHKATQEMKRYFPGLYSGKTSSSNVAPKTNIKAEISTDSERRRLYKASKDFQAIFIGQMLSAMRKNLNPESDPLFGGNRQKIFEDMLYDEYSKKMSENSSFNLADQIYEQMSPSLGKIKNDIVESKIPDHSMLRQSEKKLSQERIGREIFHSKNRLSTDQLFREEDWRP